MKPDNAGIGSPDIYQIIEKLDRIKRYSQVKEEEKMSNNPVVIEHMENTVEHGHSRVLLARLLTLKFFIQTAQEIPGGLQPFEHRRLWVLMQAQPQIFSPNFDVDIFTDLSQLLRHVSTDDLKSSIISEFRQLHSMLEAEIPPVFCVLDQVEVTTTLWHPFLRPFWLLWTSVLPQIRLVFSGTGIRLESLQHKLVSSAFGLQPYEIENNIGAFEKPSAQAEYIKYYVPACWTDSQWKAFLLRAWEWFAGR
jgi:hypothetical protein